MFTAAAPGGAASALKPRDLAALVLLAALWGSSFLFMRIAAPQFGPVLLVAVRVGIAALMLVTLLAVRGHVRALWGHWRVLLVLGVANTALPFALYAWAMLSIAASFAAVTNATAPLFAALIGWLWLRDKLSLAASMGLAVGFAGVVVLVWPRLSGAGDVSIWAVAACFGATLSYGWSANYTKRRLAGVDALVIAAGSQLYATLALLPLAIIGLPAESPSADAWFAALFLGVACTGFAYILYFRLLVRVGPARAVGVAYLVPVFGMLWGSALLDERITSTMMLACAIILAGIGLSSGVLRFPRLRR